MITPEVYMSFRNNLLSGDRHACAEITKRLIDNSIPLKELYIDLFQTAMYEIGDLWEHDKITPAVEHLASGITEYCMSLAYPLIFNAVHKEKTAIVSCLVNEYHQIGARMVADFFELHGWHGYFLGANTPVRSLIEMIKDKNPDIIGLSISLYSNVPALIKVVNEINANFNGLPIIAGGMGLKNDTAALEKLHSNIKIVRSLDSLEIMINENE